MYVVLLVVLLLLEGKEKSPPYCNSCCMTSCMLTLKSFLNKDGSISRGMLCKGGGGG